MGKATRWLRGLLGMKKDRENIENNSNCCDSKKRRSFAKPAKDSGGLVNFPASNELARPRYCIADNEKEQNKHAIAVAAATAAATEAAVAAAQAAVAVVRLTSCGRGALFGGNRETLAAVKIQTVFRGYLARKALRALKGVVKLQALVRGYLVRKRAAATLYSMHALFRAQVAARSQRARRSIGNDHRDRLETRPRKSIERYDENRSVEFYSMRLSGSYDHPNNAFEESSSTEERDTCGPRSKSRRMNTCMSEYSDDQYYRVESSPCLIPARLSIPDCRHNQDFDWGFIAEDYKCATAQTTPRFACSGRAHMPVTPTKSLCGDSYFRPYLNYPSYMANTQSFRAKQRSHSAPKQRHELGPKKRVSLNDLMASRTSFSGVRMHRPCSQVQEIFEFQES